MNAANELIDITALETGKMIEFELQLWRAFHGFL